jgi:ABC-2 type transport system ATP-binding protein
MFQGGRVLLSIENVTKRYEGHTAVDDLSLVIEPGVIYGLLGPNGAGKTTTIRMTMGIIQPDEGRIEILGEPFNESLKEKIGYLPEERGLYRKMKVLEHLVFLAEIKGLPAKTAAERASGWLERVDLAGWEDKPVEALSKGMQQKIQFISTIIHEPRLVILDEPFSGLDPINTQLLKDVIVEMKDEGRTVILSTHLMDQVEKLCEKICLINKGRKILEGSLSEIKMKFSKNVVSMRFAGDVRDLERHPDVEKVTEFGQGLSVTLSEGADPADMLRHALDRGRVDRFEVGEMSLHDIFISRVKAKGGDLDEEDAARSKA